LEIFKTVIGVFEGIASRTVEYSDGLYIIYISLLLKLSLLLAELANQENRLKEATLNLVVKCLSYDFSGSSVDESGEDIGVIQVSSLDKFLPCILVLNGPRQRFQDHGDLYLKNQVSYRLSSPHIENPDHLFLQK
jgi:hypothetical protein